ncbi:hypothetical protein K435DRAFT_874426 [Dendrothele bispora CBS 962.96]|uniref:Uncharacterized protein n=1 Tax=Dendrothele bispora (strain CBS 962.96) TaxID=1314807 RepID=A0A4S8KWN4_DENBC|nr:hypothetical protein K435DRAFT_874426 [Dendrothele bispora CBS 962.96]
MSIHEFCPFVLHSTSSTSSFTSSFASTTESGSTSPSAAPYASPPPLSSLDTLALTAMISASLPVRLDQSNSLYLRSTGLRSFPSLPTAVSQELMREDNIRGGNDYTYTVEQNFFMFPSNFSHAANSKIPYPKELSERKAWGNREREKAGKALQPSSLEEYEMKDFEPSDMPECKQLTTSSFSGSSSISTHHLLTSEDINNGGAMCVCFFIYVNDELARIYLVNTHAKAKFNALPPQWALLLLVLSEYAALGSDITANADLTFLIGSKREVACRFAALERALVDVTNKVGVDIKLSPTVIIKISYLLISDMMERNMLSNAAKTASKVELLTQQALRASSLFLYSDIAAHNKIERNEEELMQAHKRLKSELQAAKARAQQTGADLLEASEVLSECRNDLERFRRETFERVGRISSPNRSNLEVGGGGSSESLPLTYERTATLGTLIDPVNVRYLPPSGPPPGHPGAEEAPVIHRAKILAF